MLNVNHTTSYIINKNSITFFYLINMKTAYHMLVVNVQDILELAAIAVV